MELFAERKLLVVILRWRPLITRNCKKEKSVLTRYYYLNEQDKTGQEKSPSILFLITFSSYLAHISIFHSGNTMPLIKFTLI